MNFQNGSEAEKFRADDMHRQLAKVSFLAQCSTVGERQCADLAFVIAVHTA